MVENSCVPRLSNLPQYLKESISDALLHYMRCSGIICGVLVRKSLIEHVALVNLRTGRMFSDKMRMFFLKLPLMEKSPEECEDMLDIWIYIFKNLEDMNTIPQSFVDRNSIFQDFGNSARVAALSKEERIAYEASLKAYRDNHAIMETERQAGRAEANLKTAKALKALKVAPSIISQATGLSPEEIASL